MTQRMRTIGVSVLAAAAAALVGCAAPGAPGGGAATNGPARGPKVLTVAELREAGSIYGFTGEGGTGSGAGIVGALVHDLLVRPDAFEVLHPFLATETPSVERGSWRLNPDGSMDVTWKIKDGVAWHDGAPFTSADLLFALTLFKDPDLPTAQAPIARLIGSASAPDPTTLVVHWPKVDIRGNEGGALTPMPRHLLEETYRGDKLALQNSPLFRDQWVGLGPYRMTTWEQGSHIEVTRFEGYHLGRPPLDRIIVRYIGDPNTMVANILSGSIDVILEKSVELTTALEVKRQWEGTGNLVRVEPLPRIAYLELMLRPEYARPLNGLPVLAVRQGLYHAIDRQGIAEVAAAGLTPIADSWYAPTDPLRRDLESFIVKYPYDPQRAQQLIAQGGWTRGGDGILVHSTSERFDLEVWVNPQTSETAAAIVADNWRRLGVNSTVHEIPAARAQDRSYSAQRPGPLVTGAGTSGTGIVDRYDSRDFATEANRWAGRNRGGYANPRADELLDRLKMTIDPRERLPLLQEQVRIFTTDLPLMPLYWEPMAMLQLKHVKADIHPNASGFRTYLWDRE